MPFRVGQERGRKDWYVYVDRPKTHHSSRGGKTVRRKAGDSREEALRNALRIEAELVQQWAATEPLNPFQAALRATRSLCSEVNESKFLRSDMASRRRANDGSAIKFVIEIPHGSPAPPTCGPAAELHGNHRLQRPMLDLCGSNMPRGHEPRHRRRCR